MEKPADGPAAIQVSERDADSALWIHQGLDIENEQ